MGTQHLIWIDLETGGLNGRLECGKIGADYYPILEIAVIVTDTQLNELGEPLVLKIGQTPESLSTCSEWALNTHRDSGLINAVLASELTLEKAEQVVIGYLKHLGIRTYDRKNKTGGMLAGNGISFDRSYMMCQLPALLDYLHYRQLDVSSFALAARMWKPGIEAEAVAAKEFRHEALADIRESIAEFRFYKKHFLID